MTDYYEYSIPELVQMLGARFKDYRMRSNMTQKDVAEQAGLTVNTIHKFENGRVPNLSLSTFLLLMKAVGCINGLDGLMPELPESPYLVKEGGKKAQRIRHASPKSRTQP
ncbi:MAG: helix-turn-helix domain-containing protein [Bacteroidales bacterium]|jgi:transcriptional regulator with XRE-family HTH domain|nr:helix-turn-helix domain-containing protein [Bacteroidales bacterium]MBQ3734590.1 helix-turn-helix domain-containing protein [Bacteroidales bacterium]